MPEPNLVAFTSGAKKNFKAYVFAKLQVLCHQYS